MEDIPRGNTLFGLLQLQESPEGMSLVLIYQGSSPCGTENEGEIKGLTERMERLRREVTLASF